MVPGMYVSIKLGYKNDKNLLFYCANEEMYPRHPLADETINLKTIGRFKVD